MSIYRRLLFVTPIFTLTFCLFATQAQAGLSRADRAMLVKISRVHSSYLRQAEAVKPAVRSRQTAYHNWYLAEHTVGQPQGEYDHNFCLNNFYYAYKNGGSDPTAMRAFLVSFYNGTKYVDALQPLYKAYGSYAGQVAALRSNGLSAGLKKDLTALKTRVAWTWGKMKAFRSLGSSVTSHRLMVCRDIGSEWIHSNPWTWSSRPTSISTAGNIFGKVDDVAAQLRKLTLPALAKRLGSIHARSDVRKFISSGGWGLGFSLINEDNNLSLMRTATPVAQANQAALYTISQAVSRLTVFHITHGNSFCMPDEKNATCTYYLADELNTEPGNNFNWIDNSAAAAGGVGSPAPRNLLANDAENQVRGTGVNDTPCAPGSCNNPASVYIQSALDTEYGGVTFCVGSKGSKNYCAALLGSGGSNLVATRWTLRGDGAEIDGGLFLTSGSPSVLTTVSAPTVGSGSVELGWWQEIVVS